MSKDAVFQCIALIGEEVIAALGRAFATGAFVLAAGWITEGRRGPRPHPAASLRAARSDRVL